MSFFSRFKRKKVFQPVFLERLNSFDKSYLSAILTLEFPNETFTLDNFSVEFLVEYQTKISSFNNVFGKLWDDPVKAGYDLWLCQSGRELVFTQQDYKGFEDYLGHTASMYPRFNFEVHKGKIFSRDVS